MTRLPRSANILSRRRFLAAACAAPAIIAGTQSVQASPSAETVETPADVPGEDYHVEHGRIKQSVYGWPFAPMPMEQLIRASHRMGIRAMDVGKDQYPLLKELGMMPMMVSGHGFKVGPLNRANHPFCIERLRGAIDTAVAWGSPHVITFTGMREEGISDEQAAQNCVDCWKQVTGYAEQKGVNLCLEILNSRDDTHPMKGHPGQFGDDVDLCIDLIRRVDSPRMKLLFDVYHVQVMNGDIIRRIGQCQEYIGHYHVAGCPGRGEPDDTQELNYPAIMRAILETGYTGHVSQEFIPTWPDKLAALRYAVRKCDV